MSILTSTAIPKPYRPSRPQPLIKTDLNLVYFKTSTFQTSNSNHHTVDLNLLFFHHSTIYQCVPQPLILLDLNLSSRQTSTSYPSRPQPLIKTDLNILSF
jgi:hypothetical protein